MNIRFSKKDIESMKKSARPPVQRKVLHLDQEHDVIYFAVNEEDRNSLEQSVQPNGEKEIQKVEEKKSAYMKRNRNNLFSQKTVDTNNQDELSQNKTIPKKRSCRK